MLNKVKIGLIGLGHLGKIHLKCLKQSPFVISGIFDINHQVATIIGEEHGIPVMRSIDELINEVDCVDIVSTTSSHYDIASKCIEAGKHVFIEKPITETLVQAEELVKNAKDKKVLVQVGHVERYNPAVISLKDHSIQPRFVEAHRLATFNPRGTDVSVVLDLMIHDIDILLHYVKSEIKNVYANGVSIVSQTPDICNARIEFENGAVANLTASRVSLKNMRKIRIFQEDAYLSLDFLGKEAQVIKIKDHVEDDSFEGMTMETNAGIKRIIIESPAIMQSNAIEEELTDFYRSIIGEKDIVVSAADGLKALRLAHRIHEAINLQ